ncbi:unnamed protein product [Dovyalis caffra]|uniref:TF-B3 domain-containing protein n=1 Tax=Dovyalis caffra TaxID=77055 RepID=A0AAV1RB76_9ROSI|nr:unnamed protein product [Dovyalis caffra]
MDGLSNLHCYCQILGPQEKVQYKSSVGQSLSIRKHDTTSITTRREEVGVLSKSSPALTVSNGRGETIVKFPKDNPSLHSGRPKIGKACLRRIPKKFAMKFGEELSEVAKVVDPTGHALKIGLTKAENNIWFDDGWQKFPEHHSISCRYVIVFKYGGLSNFSAHIFDMSGCEIPYRRSGLASDEEINFVDYCLVHDEAEMEDDGPIKILDSRISSPSSALQSGVFGESASKGGSSRLHSPAEQSLGTQTLYSCASAQGSPGSERLGDKMNEKHMEEEYLETIVLDGSKESRKRKVIKKHRISGQRGSLFKETKADNSRLKIKFDENELQSKWEEEMESVVCSFPNASQANKRAIQAAKTFKSKNPSFMTLLQPYNFFKGILNVPYGITRRYSTEVSDNITLKVSDEREWPAKLTAKKRIISKGWHAFHTENDLKEGDVCVFEIMIESRKVEFKVTIFRAGEGNSSAS